MLFKLFVDNGVAVRLEPADEDAPRVGLAFAVAAAERVAV